MPEQATMPWGYKLGEHDFIPTPPDVTRALLQTCRPPRDGQLLEPAAGNGAILEVLFDFGYRPDQTWAVELRETERAGLEKVFGVDLAGPVGPSHVVIGDWLERSHACLQTFDVIITNPPFSLLPEFIYACLRPRPKYCAMLMPIEELAGVKRAAEWVGAAPPTGLIPLSWRPFPNVRGVAWYLWVEGDKPLNITVI